MRKPTEEVWEEAEPPEEEDDDSRWMDRYPSETIRAVQPNEAVAGIDVTLYDLSEMDEPPMFEFHQYYPEEDGVDGDSVYIHGEHAPLKLMSAISELLSTRHDEVPWDWDERDTE